MTALVIIGDGKIDCPPCRGFGYVAAAPGEPAILRCKTCDGLGRTWAPGAPSFGCPTNLGERTPGEIVTTATGIRARVLWQMPKREKIGKVWREPDTTFLGLIDDFDDHESTRPTPYPARLGVTSIEFAKVASNEDDGAGGKHVDPVDPVFAQSSVGKATLL